MGLLSTLIPPKTTEAEHCLGISRCATMSLISSPKLSSVSSPVRLSNTARTTFPGSSPATQAGVVLLACLNQTPPMSASTMTAVAIAMPYSRPWSRGCYEADAIRLVPAGDLTDADIWARNAKARSLADWNRWSGCFSMHRATVREPAGKPVPLVVTSGADLAVGPFVTGPVDFSHTSGAELFKSAVVLSGLADNVECLDPQFTHCNLKHLKLSQ